MVQLPIAPRVGPDCSDVVCCEDFMLISFPMDNATEKRSNFSYATSQRARHEALFGSGEYSGENSSHSRVARRFFGSGEISRENAVLSKCHCSVATGSTTALVRGNGSGSPSGIEIVSEIGSVVGCTVWKWLRKPVRD